VPKISDTRYTPIFIPKRILAVLSQLIENSKNMSTCWTGMGKYGQKYDFEKPYREFLNS
jgi:hypothetical protein